MKTLAILALLSHAIQPSLPISDRQALNGFGCTGGNVSPDLTWTGAPAGTKSYAVTLYDPDVRTGSGWWHWVVFNIPSSVTSLAAGQKPAGIESRTDFGSPGYGGPCPPEGDAPHRYIFKVYALKDMIPLDAQASGAMVGFYIQQLKIGEGTLETRHGRGKAR
jgi:Raf kinase inhibitor-like YbhB/YbcL family protein